MITIRLQYDTNNIVNGFTVSGHAEYGEPGTDIVCAAVSALTQTALLGLLHNGKDNTQYEVRDGFLSVHVIKMDEKSEVILETMVLGMEEIVRKYDQYIVLDR